MRLQLAPVMKGILYVIFWLSNICLLLGHMLQRFLSLSLFCEFALYSSFTLVPILSKQNVWNPCWFFSFLTRKCLLSYHYVYCGVPIKRKMENHLLVLSKEMLLDSLALMKDNGDFFASLLWVHCILSTHFLGHTFTSYSTCWSAGVNLTNILWATFAMAILYWHK